MMQPYEQQLVGSMWIIFFLTLALLCFVIAKGCNEDEKIFTLTPGVDYTEVKDGV